MLQNTHCQKSSSLTLEIPLADWLADFSTISSGTFKKVIPLVEYQNFSFIDIIKHDQNILVTGI